MNSSVVARAHLVEARAVVKSFGQTTALRGASAAVSAGEIFAIMTSASNRG
jgi:ABC-type sugar transport system ATPase subunit